MSTATATAEASPAAEPTPAPTAQAAVRRLTDRLGLATAFLAGHLGRTAARVRVALDLPSRAELAAVNARLEAVEAQLAADDDGDDDRRRRRRRG